MLGQVMARAHEQRPAHHRQHRHLGQDQQIEMALEEGAHRIGRRAAAKVDKAAGRQRRRGHADHDDEKGEGVEVPSPLAIDIGARHMAGPQAQVTQQGERAAVGVRQRMPGLVADVVQRQPPRRRALATARAMQGTLGRRCTAVQAGSRSGRRGHRPAVALRRRRGYPPRRRFPLRTTGPGAAVAGAPASSWPATCRAPHAAPGPCASAPCAGSGGAGRR
jgi:hypothetical protein